MADGKKTFYIEINGIQESVSAVDSLNKQLDALEKRIGNLSKRNINISASGGASKELDAEEKLRRQIINQEDKIIAARKDEYQILLQQKSEFKQINELQKKNLAQANLEGKAYENTMQGMKARLADIKTVLHNTDLGDTQSINKLTTEANELTNKLKEMEQAYGTFGRNVGNYANGVAEGMSKIQIKVGETTREFDNAREASRTLNMELKSMALNGQQGTKEYNDLNNAVKQMNSTLKDVETSSVAMDNLLDTMQGIVAVASTAKGLSSIFGLDEGAIEQTIQKLVALQNVLQGIEVIRKQMQTQEGIGLLLSKGNKAVDALVTSIFGLGTASKGATIAVKALSTALKGIGIGLVVAAVSTLITKISDWISKQEEAKKAAEELRKETNKNKAALETTRLEMQNTLSTLERFNGSKKEEEKIVKDLNSKYGQALGTYKTIAQWKDALKKKTDAYIESLELEFEMQQAIKKMEDAYIKKKEVDQSQASDYVHWYNPFSWGNGAQEKKVMQAQADQAYNDAKEVVTNLKKKIDKHNEKNKINIYSPQDGKETKKKIKDDSKKIEEAIRQAENNINDLRLKLMSEGLRKELAQLDENNRKELEKIRKNGQKVEEQEKLLAKNYQKARKEILDKYNQDTQGIIDETTAKKIQNEIDKIDASLDKLGRKMNVTFNEPRSSLDNLTKKLKEAGMTVNDFMFVGKTEPLRKTSFNEGKFDEYMQQLTQDGKIQKYLIEKWGDDVAEYTTDAIEEAYNKVYSRVIELRREYGDMVEIFSFDENDKPSDIRATLMTSLQIRTEITRGQYKNMLKQEQDFYRQRAEMQKNALDEEEEILTRELNSKIDKEEDNLKKLRSEPVIDEKAVKATEDRINALYERLITLCEEYNQKRKKIETETIKDIAASENKLFDQRFKDYDQYMQKMQKDMSNLPTTNKWGFTDLKGLKSVITEITDATDIMRQYVQNDVDQVNDDFRNGLITEEDKNRILANLSGVLNGIDEIDKQTEEKLKDAKERRKREINEMIQIIGQAATSVIQSIGEINQAAFEKQLEAIEKQTDELEKQLDKQRELTEKYKDDVDSIEDELATARGDRRQHLIDQLNAQMQAQRESLAQEKRMEKEREKLDKKREKLEYDNEMRKWNQSKLTAAINTALAISSAAVNSWPIPAVPMIAAATAMGAAQMAAIIANKPRKYADGGLLQGRSHAQGGIKVLGGHAEVEGGEFITNRRTTAQNSDLLYYINSKKKKLDLSDMIEFYSSKPKKSISGMKRMFADGGELPTIRTDIELNSRLIDTMEKYSERPVQVEVVEIMNKTEDVRRTQVLAGLS